MMNDYNAAYSTILGEFDQFLAEFGNTSWEIRRANLIKRKVLFDIYVIINYVNIIISHVINNDDYLKQVRETCEKYGDPIINVVDDVLSGKPLDFGPYWIEVYSSNYSKEKWLEI